MIDRRNIAKYWYDRHMPGLSLMRADFTSHNYARHTHDAFVIALTEVGGAYIRSRNTMETAWPGTLFVSNPEEPQSAWMGKSERWCYRSIYLARPAIDAVGHGLGLDGIPFFTRNMFDDHDLIDGFGQSHRALEAGNDDFLGHELLIGVLGTLFRRHGSGGGRVEMAPRDQVLVGKVVNVMRARCSERLRLTELADAVDMTTFQLIRLFKRTIGITPHAHLIHLRLNLACRYLRRGYTIAESALEAGFCDQSALTKHFKSSYGITPLQFAAAAGARQ